jgi:acetyl coenzyme A synthetase (ADP forming)-like protein
MEEVSRPISGADLSGLFSPRSIAVVGASRRTSSVGFTLFRNILASQYTGVVYPVNPSWSSVAGVRCYPSVDDLPEVPDLAIIIVPAPGVAETVERLGSRGTRQAVIISAGFREIGGEGVAREEELIRVTRRYRMHLVGPNCFGVINTDPGVSLNATFSDTLPLPGPISFISQSGALGAGILRYAQGLRIGFSKFVSIGNRAGIDENDLLSALGRDPTTRVILLYVESLADGRRFLEVARRVTEEKPVVAIKSGRTPSGEVAARSHTGSLARASSDRLFDALFEQAGVLRADNLGELFLMAKVFSGDRRMRGRRIAILTNSGGPGILAADMASRQGLDLPELSRSAQRRLRGFLSPIASVRNPVDMTADTSGDRYRRALRVILRDPVDGVLVIGTPTGETTGREMAESILGEASRSRKPIVACLFGLTDLSEEVGLLERAGVPSLEFPEQAAEALSYLARYGAWRRRPRTQEPDFEVDRRGATRRLRAYRRRGRTSLAEGEARRILECYGIPFPPARLARTEEEAVRAAGDLGFPVVLKVSSPDILHKTEVGGVRLHLETEDDVRKAWRALREEISLRVPQARWEGALVEQEVRGGREVILGAQRDPQFGPIVLFGLGGVYVEVLKDVTFRLAPMRRLSARHMVRSIQGFPLLEGVRGEGPADLDALEEILLRLSQFIVEQDLVQELDVNPLLVRGKGQGAVAVDARIVLQAPLSSRSGPPA